MKTQEGRDVFECEHDSSVCFCGLLSIKEPTGIKGGTT